MPPPEKKRLPVIEIAPPQDEKIGLPGFKAAGPVELGSNLFQTRTVKEGIPSALASGGASLLRGFLEGVPQVSRGTALSGPGQMFSGQYLPELPEFEPLEKFKNFLKDVEVSNDYTEKHYQGETFHPFSRNSPKRASLKILTVLLITP